MTVHQIRSQDGTGTLSYLVTHKENAIAIDPNIEDVEVFRSLARKLGVTITHIVDTHTHADHISGAGELRKLYKASVAMHENTKNKWKIVDEGDKFGIGDILRANAAIPVDLYVNDGDTIVSGELKLHVLFTPGHTDNHIALHAEGNIFTGDLLLIGQAGRSDLPGGNPEQQYESLVNKILPLPDSTKIYPGHDYADQEFALLGNERKSNPFLQQHSKDAYVAFVREFFPPIAESTGGEKMTLQCGTQRVPQAASGVTNIQPEELAVMLEKNGDLFLLDVREPFEVSAAAIQGVKNISIRILPTHLGMLPADKTNPVVSICQSGSRSFEAAHFLHQQGYVNVMNLVGGTSGWMKKGYKVVQGQVEHQR